MRKAYIVAALAVAQMMGIGALSVRVACAQTWTDDAVIFSNTEPITINTASGLTAPTKAAVYPSTVTVAGMTGSITRVAVTLNGLSHTRMTDLDMLLVSPGGVKYIFLADGFNQGVLINDRVYTFDDQAPATLPAFSEPFSGTYKPTSGDGVADTFPSPAPPGPYLVPSHTFAGAFNGTDPNGQWSLYIVDDIIGTAHGGLDSGWSLTITTDTTAATTFANSAPIPLTDSVTPATAYGSSISVSGMTGELSKLRVTLNGLSHTATGDVDILLVTPNGASLVLMSDVGAGSVSNVDLTFDDAALQTLPGAFTSGTYKPTDSNTTTEIFFTPAPGLPYNTGASQLARLNGLSPNGDWRLFVVDDNQNNSGTISGGWSLDITTTQSSERTMGSCAAPFFTTTNLAAGAGPTNLAIADFNNDSKPDLAVTNQISNDVSILLGNGDGTFAPQIVVSVGSSPYALAAGKFNSDNNIDLAVVNSGSNNVTILPGNGDGTFGTPATFFAGSTPISIAVGDLNGDAKQDLAVANFGSFFTGTVSILLGNGSGGFTNGTTVRTRTQPSYVAIADLNGDSVSDLVVANFGTDDVTTFFGNGNGTFFQQQVIATGNGPVAIELADLGNDGIADLAVANYNGDSYTTCSGTAAGGFTGCTSNNPAGGTNPISLAAADFNSTGTKRLAVALSGSDIVKVLTTNVPVGVAPNAVETADLNGDQVPDLVAVNFGSNDVTVMLNRACSVARGELYDFNGDGKTDNAVFRPSQAAWYNSQLSSLKILGRPTDKAVPADYDGDGKTDFAFYRPESGLWQVVGPTSNPIYFYQFGGAQDIPVPADYDGDGKADIAVWRPDDGTWYYRRSSDNSFGVFPWGTSGDRPVPADYDGDGRSDIAVYRPSTGIWYVLRSSDNQLFAIQFGSGDDKTVVADYDGDGKADIAVWRPSSGIWFVINSSNGALQTIAWGVNTDVPAPGDYDGDGLFDAAVFRPSNGTWYARKSSDNAAQVMQFGVSGDVPLPSVAVR